MATTTIAFSLIRKGTMMSRSVSVGHRFQVRNVLEGHGMLYEMTKTGIIMKWTMTNLFIWKRRLAIPSTKQKLMIIGVSLK